jgi:site-specific recombinase XerD
MASSSTFVLKEPKGDTSTLIYLVIRFNSYEVNETGKKKYKQVKFSTGMKWIPKHWDIKKHKGINRQGYPDPAELNQGLQNIKTAAADIYRRLVNNGIKISADSLREELHKREDLFPDLRKHEVRSSALKSVSENLVSFYENYIKDVKFIYKKGKPYPVSDRTRQKYATTLRHLKAFITFKKRAFDFEDIDLEFYQDFVDYLRNHAKKAATEKVPNPEPIKMTENTVGKHITTLKTILNTATEAGVNTNKKFQSQKFAILTEDVDKIYLTESELKKIYEHDFSKTKSLDRVRDLFLVGCYTCLRFSDFTNIKPENIYNNEKGTFIKLSTMKTGETVVIPLHWIVTAILQKYNYELPKSISNQKMNDYLKDIGEKASIDEPVSITKFEGGVKVTRTAPKYKLISTHTARRSGATNMYLAGIPAISIMKITGHRTEQSFMRYIKMTQEDNANKLIDHPFFKNDQKLKVV